MNWVKCCSCDLWVHVTSATDIQCCALKDWNVHFCNFLGHTTCYAHTNKRLKKCTFQSLRSQHCSGRQHTTLQMSNVLLSCSDTYMYIFYTYNFYHHICDWKDIPFGIGQTPQPVYALCAARIYGMSSLSERIRNRGGRTRALVILRNAKQFLLTQPLILHRTCMAFSDACRNKTDGESKTVCRYLDLS